MSTFQHYKDRLQAQGIYLDFLDEPVESLRRRREGAYVSYIYGNGNRRVKVIIIINCTVQIVYGKLCLHLRMLLVLCLQ